MELLPPVKYADRKPDRYCLTTFYLKGMNRVDHKKKYLSINLEIEDSTEIGP